MLRAEAAAGAPVRTARWIVCAAIWSAAALPVAPSLVWMAASLGDCLGGAPSAGSCLGRAALDGVLGLAFALAEPTPGSAGLHFLLATVATALALGMLITALLARRRARRRAR